MNHSLILGWIILLSVSYFFYVFTNSFLVAVFGMFCTIILSLNNHSEPHNGTKRLLKVAIDGYMYALLAVSVWAASHVVYRLGNSMFGAFVASILQSLTLWKLLGHV